MAAVKHSKKIDTIMSDFRLFAKNFIKIIDNNNESVPFVLNSEQEQFLNEMTKYNIILKGRQLGFTTFSLGYMVYSACTKPDTSYIIITHHNSVTKSLFNKLKKIYNSLPHSKFPGVFPKTLLNNRDELSLDNGSRIVVATASGEDSISGNTFQMIHLSEMAKYPNANQEEIIATAIPALAKNPHSRIVIESTAMGYNEYQKMFTKAWRGKESVWKAHFFSWLAHGYFEQFKHSFSEAEEWFKVHNKGKRMTEEHLEPEEFELRDKYGANYRQLMYRRYYIETNSLEKWNREFPTYPEQAFMQSNKSIFDTEKVINRISHATPPITNKHDLSVIPESLHQYLNKKLFIYNLPTPNMRHFGGVDVSSGIGGNADSSTISIYNAEGQQMASFYANDIPTYKFASIIDDLGRFFNYAFLCIERNNYGLPLIEKLKIDYSYTNLYKQRIFNQQGVKKTQLGFTTSHISKPVLIDQMKTSFELGFINIECLETLEQMKIYEDNDGKLGNKKGLTFHDDLVISTALMCQALKTNKYYVEIPA
ncbi:DNA packaging protein [Priestia koreensis]|uniref:DNA packaging protein n=1 Tax=Priestia koreensis TaxID=284581 RepID=UPI003CFC233F